MNRNLKTSFLLTAALCLSTLSQAQVDIDMSKVFNVTDTPVELNEAKAKVADGIAYVGDTRPADKIQDGKYRGMRAVKMRRTFSVDGKARQFTNALAFRRTPTGATREHVVDVTMVPRSCMMQLKPTADGTFSFEVFSTKPESKIYVGVLNGSTWRNLGELTYVNEGKKGTKADPLSPLTLEYKHQAGDEVWIYSDGTAYLMGMQFSGQLDASYQGTDAMEAYKAVRKAGK